MYVHMYVCMYVHTVCAGRNNAEMLFSSPLRVICWEGGITLSDRHAVNCRARPNHASAYYTRAANAQHAGRDEATSPDRGPAGRPSTCREMGGNGQGRGGPGGTGEGREEGREGGREGRQGKGRQGQTDDGWMTGRREMMCCMKRNFGIFTLCYCMLHANRVPGNEAQSVGMTWASSCSVPVPGPSPVLSRIR
jgi:hypothetical protein